MKTIKITITFSGAAGGDISVRIQGPGTDINYEAKGSDPRPDRSFDLMPALYSIKLHGLSGGKVNLLIEDGATKLVNMPCPTPNIFILTSFTV